MIADGWRCHVLWTFSDTDSIQRRYTAWAEHHTQGWFMHGPLAAKFDCVWDWQEPRPLHGENRSNSDHWICVCSVYLNCDGNRHLQSTLAHRSCTSQGV